MKQRPQGPQASRLRQRKFRALERFAIPEDLLPGSLSASRTRCGKSSCHCARPEDPGHLVWTYTFMSGGRKRTLHVPAPMVPELERRLAASRRFQEAVREVMTANAELLVLARRQQRSAKR